MTERGAGRRASILAAARALLAERGAAEAVGVDEIAARAGTTKATLYRYFPSKAGLLAEAVADGVVPAEAGRRERILDAATRVVPLHGLHGTTMDRIAAEAGVSPATLYWHFCSKDELLFALVEHLSARFAVPRLLAQVRVDEPEALLRLVVPRLLELLGERLELFLVLVAEVGARPALAARVYDLVVGRTWSVVAGLMADQVAAGAFRPGHSLLRVQALAGMLFAYSLARRNFGERIDVPPPAEAAHEFVEIFLRGVLTGTADAADRGGRQPVEREPTRDPRRQEMPPEN